MSICETEPAGRVWRAESPMAEWVGSSAAVRAGVEHAPSGLKLLAG